MAIIKCKMCGGDIELSADKSFGVCEFCGSTMTLPKVDDEQRAAAFNRGNHFRRIGEFDKALTVYETLVRDDEADAEAHWCCALCRFGIEYVKDPASGEYIPTCHRASFDSFLEDVDTREAIKHADAVARRQYERDAQVIEEVRRGILTLSQNERPYDVFICYKETDDRGQRTRDSQRAQEIYYQLTDQGRRVFFARITLEDKAGQQYEPYIFAALNSARVMIVVGTRREHLEAVWVKNEWSRFLALMKRDRKKLLIPCYADMDPYDMPEQLSVLQSYDMTKIGFIQDLTRGISKVLDADKKPEPAAPAAEQPMMSGNVRALLKRGYMALEDGDWERADEFFEQVLNQDAECAEAYMGKALAEQKAKTFKMLLNTRKQKYQRVEKEELFITTDEKRANKAAAQWTIPNYLSEDTIRQIYTFRESYKSEIKHWTEAKRQEKDWWGSDRNITRARRYAAGTYKQELEDGYKSLIAFFDGKISDATARCDADKKAIEQKFAQFNDEADKKVAELYAKGLKDREVDYSGACEAQGEAEQEEDVEKLESISNRFNFFGDFKDSKRRHDDCLKVIDAIEEKRHQEEEKRRQEEEKHLAIEKRKQKKRTTIITLASLAVIIVAVAGMFAKSHIDAYKRAEALVAEGKYDEAVSAFTELGNFKDAADRVNQTKYAQAENLLAKGKIAEAAIAFGKIKYFKDSASRSHDLWGNTKYVVPIACGGSHTVGLKSDGTVIAVGDNWAGQCDVSEWRDIVAVSAGDNHTVGLKSDGTVVAVGDSDYSQCDVSKLTDIVAVSAGYYHTVGLKSDGTVVAVGRNVERQCNVSDWTDIIAISAGRCHTVGLKSDGTVVAVGDNRDRQCNVSDWTDIIAISAGPFHTVGLKSDGTVVAVGETWAGQCDVSEWRDIVAVSAGGNHTVGLKSDGTVIAVGDNWAGQCDVSEWRDIVAVSAGGSHTVGLKSDGTVVAVGDNDHGQCDVSGWTDIWIPKQKWERKV